jgi:hypothetical protein
MPKFHSQFDATESDIAFARTFKGKISPVITQATGPHVDAKKAWRKVNTPSHHCGNDDTYDVNANKGNKNLLPSDIIDRDGNANDSDNIFAYAHANGTD